MRSIYDDPNYEELIYNKIVDILESQGYYSYANLLGDFEVLITDDPNIGIAAINVDAGEIYIRRGQEAGNDKFLSFVIRHELLHKILEHQERFMRKVANEMGVNYEELDDSNINEFYQKLAAESISYRHMSVPRRDNISKDFEVSRYYDLDDEDLARTLGALLISDHPDWANLTFEEIHDLITKEDKELKRRLRPIAHGDFDSDGKFNTTSLEPSIFEGTDIAIQDIKGISIPNLEEAVELIKIHDWSTLVQLNNTDVWIKDSAYFHSDSEVLLQRQEKLLNNEDGAMYLSNNYNVSYGGIQWNLDVFVILNVPNLDLYKNLKPGMICTVAGIEFVVLPANNTFRYEKIISKNAIGSCAFNTSMVKGNTYKGSNIEQAVHNWFKQEIR